MGKDSEERGLFAVRIDISDGRITAVLTGDHYRGNDAALASSVSQAMNRRSFAKGESPVFLVDDAVVEIAVGAYRRAPRSGLSDCHSGRRGHPCGRCESCMAARREAFTRVVLGHIERPKDELYDRVRNAICSVIGMTWVDAPWRGSMSDEEVEKVFSEIGTNKGKVETNEAY